MNVTKRTRLNKIEIDNAVGKPTRIIFRSTTFLEGLDVEIEDVAKIVTLDRENADVMIDGADITVRQVIDALWGMFNNYKEPDFSSKPEQL